MLVQAKADLRQFWETNYADVYTTYQPITPQHTIERDDYAAFLLQTTAAAAAHNRANVIDELEIYLREAALPLYTKREINSFYALTWWLKETQQTQFPKLSKMACDLLTISAISAEIERVFSEYSLALNTQRLQLSRETLEQPMCLRSWCRQELRVRKPYSWH